MENSEAQVIKNSKLKMKRRVKKTNEKMRNLKQGQKRKYIVE